MANRLHQVGLAQANAAANKQRIELTAGGLGHGQGRRVGHAAVLTHHEAVEHVAGVQSLDRLAAAFAGGGSRRCWLSRRCRLGR